MDHIQAMDEVIKLNIKKSFIRHTMWIHAALFGKDHDFYSMRTKIGNITRKVNKIYAEVS